MSQPTRRNGNSSLGQNKQPATSVQSTAKVAPSSRPSPYILLLYPIILTLGSLFSILSPSASPPSYSAALTPGVASDLNTPQTPATLSYFASKSNIVNLYFVKIGWFWTTLAFVLVHAIGVFTTVTPTKSQPDSRRKHLLQAAARYATLTLFWFLVTQWFFGPALIDRSFTSTGGRCLMPQQAQHEQLEKLASAAQTIPLHSEPILVTTGLACKASGGKWQGGHDISGHFFMLVLSSAALFLELCISERHGTTALGSASEQRIKEKEITRDATRQDSDDQAGTVSQSKVWVLYFIWAVIVLDIWMLLMTAIWFHTVFEKVSGLVLSTAVVWGIYFLPRGGAIEGWTGLVGGV